MSEQTQQTQDLTKRTQDMTTSMDQQYSEFNDKNMYDTMNLKTNENMNSDIDNPCAKGFMKT